MTTQSFIKCEECGHNTPEFGGHDFDLVTCDVCGAEKLEPARGLAISKRFAIRQRLRIMGDDFGQIEGEIDVCRPCHNTKTMVEIEAAVLKRFPPPMPIAPPPDL